jgi:hypothetical protein
MDRRSTRALSAWQRVVAAAGTVGIVAGVLALGTPNASAASQAAGQRAASQSAGSAARPSASETTKDYVIRFWGRWITWTQQNTIIRLHGRNTLIGPETIDPTFQAVNLINDDTIYAFGYVDVTQGPAVLTIPPTDVTYSVLVLDMFQSVVETDLPSTPGTYLLVREGWQGTVPAGMTKVTIPRELPLTLWNIRSDKYSATNQDMVAQATAFRASLRMTTLANYQADPSSGPTKVLPTVPTFALSLKLIEDALATGTPSLFLRTLQRAAENPDTSPLSASDRQLMRAFNQDFAAAQQAARRGNPVPLARILAAVRDAYRDIVVHFRTHVGATNWIYFDNIADWHRLPRPGRGQRILHGLQQRRRRRLLAGLRRPRRLNGARHNYKLHFTADQLPDAKRFWSLTAYTPRTVELIPNPANRYLVARYTPARSTTPTAHSTSTCRSPSPRTSRPRTGCRHAAECSKSPPSWRAASGALGCRGVLAGRGECSDEAVAAVGHGGGGLVGVCEPPVDDCRDDLLPDVGGELVVFVVGEAVAAEHLADSLDGQAVHLCLVAERGVAGGRAGRERWVGQDRPLQSAALQGAEDRRQGLAGPLQRRSLLGLGDPIHQMRSGSVEACKMEPLLGAEVLVNQRLRDARPRRDRRHRGVHVAVPGELVNRRVEDLMFAVGPRHPLGTDASTGHCHTHSLTLEPIPRPRPLASANHGSRSLS